MITDKVKSMSPAGRRNFIVACLKQGMELHRGNKPSGSWLFDRKKQESIRVHSSTALYLVRQGALLLDREYTRMSIYIINRESEYLKRKEKRAEAKTVSG